MNPKKSIDCNMVISGGDQFPDLHAIRKDTEWGQEITTLWELSDEDRQRIADGGMIAIGLLWEPNQEGFPPIAASTTLPPYILDVN